MINVIQSTVVLNLVFYHEVISSISFQNINKETSANIH